MNLFLASQDALAVIEIENDRIRSSIHLEGRSSLCVAVDPLRPESVYCGTSGDGAWRSDDAGQSWRPVGEGIAHSQVTSVAVSRLERVNGSGVVYAGTEPSEVFRSEDAGETWQQCRGLIDLPSAGEWSFPPRPETHHVRWIHPDPQAEGELFVAIEAGALVRSSDGGKSWQDRVPSGPIDTHELATNLSAPGRLYSAAGDGYFESRDGGERWENLEEGLHHTYLWSVAVDAGNADIIIVSAAASAWRSHFKEHAESFIYRRTSGAPWREVRAGLPEPAGRRTAVLAAHPRESGRFFTAWEKEVFQSRDGGANWERLDVPWPRGFELNDPRALAVSDGD